MRSRYAKWLVFAACLALATVGYFGANRYRYRFVRSDDDLLRLLPRTENTLFFAKVSVLREAGYLKLLDGAKRSQEKEYTRFVQETGFDYTKDLDAAAGMSDDEQLWFALRGHFAWNKIQRYVSRSGGTCASGECRLATGTIHRTLSMRMIQPDVMALAISDEAAGVGRIQPSQNDMTLVSAAPVWVRPSRTLLTNPAELPLGARIFAISLQSADTVVLSLQPSEAQGAAFAVAIDAAFTNQPTAETARDQLERSTQILKLEFARVHKPPQPDELGWLLTSGTFQVAGPRLSGTWLVRKELLSFLQ